MPVLSVCVPAFNAASTLPQTLQSALDQDFQDFELIVCDDGSTDDTAAVLAQFSDPRLHIHRFENGGSQAANFNRCLELATGEFVMLLHADDWVFPGFFAQRVQVLQSDPTLVLACGATQNVDGDGNPTEIARRWGENTTFPDGTFIGELLQECFIVPVSMVFRRLVAQKIAPFRPDISWGPDWEWALRLVEQGSVFYDATPRAAYRIHAGSGTAAALKSGRNGPQERMILGEAFARLAQNRRLGPLARKNKRKIWWKLALRHFWFAEQALGAGRGDLTRRNLRFAAWASRGALVRLTFWRLWAASWKAEQKI